MYRCTCKANAVYANKGHIFDGSTVTGVMSFDVVADSRAEAMIFAEAKWQTFIDTGVGLSDFAHDNWNVAELEQDKQTVFSGKSVTLQQLIDERDMLIDDIQKPLWKAFEGINNGYAILQARDDAPNKFLDYKYTEKQDITFSAKDYNILYVQKEGKTDKSYGQRCDKIYRNFNVNDRPNHQNGFYGTSLSVSDIILLKTEGKVCAVYIDNYDFKFLDDDFIKSLPIKENKSIERE